MTATRYKLCGAFSADPGAGERADAAAMLRAMGASEADAAARTVATPHGAMAGGSADAAAVATGRDGSRLLLAGRLYGLAPDAALARLAERGPQAVGEFNGPFALLWHDAPGNRVVAANDRFGLWPLYWHADAGRLRVASECKAILAVASPAPDPAGWAEFFALNHLLGNDTLWRGVRALGPGQYVQWSAGSAELHTYWRLSDLPLLDPGEVTVAGALACFDRAVARRADAAGEQVVLCSGGFDSRFILGRLAVMGHRPPLLFRQHNTRSGRAELGIVRRLADMLGLECDAELDPRPRAFLHRELESHHVLDGLREQAGVFGAMLYPRLGRWDAAWDGLVMGILLGGQHQPPGSARRAFREYARNWPMNRRLLRKVFARDWFAQLDAAFTGASEEALADMPDTADGWRRFLFAHRTRRRVAPNPLTMWARHVLPLVPGADNEMLELLVAMPHSVTRHERFYIALQRHAIPELAEVPYVTAGRHFHPRQADGTPRNALHVEDPWWRFRGRQIGLWPMLQALSRRRRGVGEAEYRPVLDVLEAFDLDPAVFNRPYVEKALRGLRAGRLYYLAPLALAMQAQLWLHMFDTSALAALRDIFDRE